MRNNGYQFWRQSSTLRSRTNRRCLSRSPKYKLSALFSITNGLGNISRALETLCSQISWPHLRTKINSRWIPPKVWRRLRKNVRCTTPWLNPICYLSLTASLGYKSFQFDVTTAFLNADVDIPIFMTQPEGFVLSGKEHHVCKLLKAVYGIKQARYCRLWCKTFIAALLKYGFKALHANMCVFILVNNNIVSYLFIWVDDGWFSSSSDEECQHFASWIGNN